jgi:hypothetical protein
MIWADNLVRIFDRRGPAPCAAMISALHGFHILLPLLFNSVGSLTGFSVTLETPALKNWERIHEIASIEMCSIGSGGLTVGNPYSSAGAGR